jgi:hypothetical protein
MLSPELALVDHDLAEWARLRLQEDAVAAKFATADIPEPPPAVAGVEAVEDVEPDRSRPSKRRSLRLLWVAATAVAAAAAVAVVVFVRASSDGSSTHGAPTVSPPKPTPAAQPMPSATVPFAWPSVSAARGYVFTLSRGSDVIYRTRTTAEQLHLKRSWKYRGHKFRLTRGAYRWSVTALVGSRSGGPRTVVSAPFWIDGSS